MTRGDGPERFHGEWWRDGAGEGDRPYTMPNYYQVATAIGSRYCRFRLGGGVTPWTGQ